MKERIVYLDYIRILACCMVIFIHAPKAAEGGSSLFLSSLSFFMNPGIGLFFMVSGALLLPAKEDTSLFLKKKIMKFVYPVVFWSLVYILLSNGGPDNPYQLIREVASIPFTPQGNGVLWFMYTLIALYLITPVLSRWLERATRREVEFYLILWTISLCYPVIELMVSVNESHTGILYYCSGYVGYYVSGYYLSRYCISFRPVALLFVFSVSVPVMFKLYGIETDFYRMFWYLSVFSMIQCVFWFVGIRKFMDKCKSLKENGFVTLFSNLTFGIYLVHILVLKEVLWKIALINKIGNYIAESLLLALLTLVFSFVISYVISLLPFAGYVIGYKHKRMK